MKKIGLLFFLLYLLGCQKGSEFCTIHFHANTTEIVEYDSSLLYQNLEILEDNPDVDVELAGHTNSVGSDSANLVLSQARADTVRLWLLRNEVDSLRLTAVGYGENNPVADNRTAEGRAENDRVEFIAE